MSALPNIRAIRAGKDRCVVITWRGGAESVIDLRQHLAQYAVFAPLRSDDDLFRTVRVGEWGGVRTGRTKWKFPLIPSGGSHCSKEQSG